MQHRAWRSAYSFWKFTAPDVNRGPWGDTKSRGRILVYTHSVLEEFNSASIVSVCGKPELTSVACVHLDTRMLNLLKISYIKVSPASTGFSFSLLAKYESVSSSGSRLATTVNLA